MTAAILRLQAAGIEDADLSARLLVAHGLKIERVQLLSQADRILSDGEQRLITVFIECRAKHEPVTRILGEREFWSLTFGLNEATLDPRPDSETLIEVTLKYFKDHKRPLRILDLGTGTGCLLLSLLHELPNATGLGIDIAPRAIEQARHNAAKLKLDHRATFAVNNWLETIQEPFDILISNPPYIASRIIPALMPEVREHDPLRALDGGKDGLDAYRQLIPQLRNHLKPGGFAVLEIGFDQAAPVRDLFKQSGFTNITVHRDLNGNDRCLTTAIDHH